MRVLHLTPLYWPSLGGGEQVTQFLSERMAQAGHAVTVVTSNAANEVYFWNTHARSLPAGAETINNVRVIRVPIRSFPLGQLSLFITRGLAIRLFDPLKLQSLVRRIGAWMPHAIDLKSALQNLPDSFDLVHGFNLSWESFLVAASDYACARSIPLVTTPFLHTGEPGQARVSRNYSMSHQIHALRSSQRVITQTSIETQALERMGVPIDRIAEIGVGIDLNAIGGGQADRFRDRYNLRGPIVAFIGRLTRDKGVTALIKAMQKIWAQNIDAECVIAGSSMPDFERFMKLQPRHPRLHILGRIDAETKRDLLAAADVIAMPSRAESFGIVYLEAWAYSKPVIGVRAGGAADLIEDDVNGNLVSFDDVSALAQKLVELLKNPSRARVLGEAGRRKLLARYTQDITFSKTMKVYEELIAH